MDFVQGLRVLNQLSYIQFESRMYVKVTHTGQALPFNQPTVMELTFPQLRNLSHELFNDVLNHCQLKELCAVAFTNSDYRIEAERVLYRSMIALNNWTPDSGFKTPDCLSTLSKIQSKANMVKSFELVYLNGEREQFSEVDIEQLSAHCST